ncbi:MAG: DUF86 domain-containing protein [Nitrospirota bacterium]
MVDRGRILGKLDELERYVRELRAIAPGSFEEFLRPEKKRACERLLQISVEATIDVCHLLVMGLRLGYSSEEADLFNALARKDVISEGLAATLKDMKGFRNILVHEYAEVDDALVYKAVRDRLGDFEAFKREVLAALDRGK